MISLPKPHPDAERLLTVVSWWTPAGVISGPAPPHFRDALALWCSEFDPTLIQSGYSPINRTMKHSNIQIDSWKDRDGNLYVRLSGECCECFASFHILSENVAAFFLGPFLEICKVQNSFYF